MNPLLIAAPVAILPAMGALWLHLRRYEGYFEDARVFFALIAGFFAGIVGTYLEQALFPFGDQAFLDEMGPAASFSFFVFGYAVFEAGAMIIVLGLKRFRTRKDTPYYGSALGLGYAAIASLVFLGAALGSAGKEGRAPYGVWTFLVLAAVPIGSIFAHAAAGVVAGVGSAAGRLASGWIKAALVLVPTTMAAWMYLPWIGYGDKAAIIPALLSLTWGLASYIWVQVKILDTIVPQEIRDQVRRERRRQARRGE